MKKIFILLCVTLVFLYACDTEPEESLSGDINGEEIIADDAGGGGEYEENIEAEENFEDFEEEAGGEADVNENENADEDLLTHLGYFIIETPAGEGPVHNDDGTLTLPAGGFVTTTEDDSRYELDSGAVLDYDGVNSPYKINIKSAFKLPGSDMKIEAADGFAVVLEELEEMYKNAGRGHRESPWEISFDSDGHAIFKFNVSDIKFVSLDSVFPMYKDAQNGVILFKKCRIELADGTIIDAPLNTKAQIDEGEFKIIIGEGDAVQTSPDGTVSAVEQGTVLS